MSLWHGATNLRPSVSWRPLQTRSRKGFIEDCAGRLLLDNKVVHDRWTEYCKDLYNFPTYQNILEKNQKATKDPNKLRVLRKEVEQATRNMSRGKSSGMDNVSGKKFKNARKEIMMSLTMLCRKMYALNVIFIIGKTWFCAFNTGQSHTRHTQNIQTVTWAIKTLKERRRKEKNKMNHTKENTWRIGNFDPTSVSRFYRFKAKEHYFYVIRYHRMSQII